MDLENLEPMAVFAVTGMVKPTSLPAPPICPPAQVGALIQATEGQVQLAPKHMDSTQEKQRGLSSRPIDSEFGHNSGKYWHLDV